MKNTVQTISERIALQQEKLAQLKARKAKLEAAEKNRINKANRSSDTRRKILVGSLILAAVNRGEIEKLFLLKILNEGLERVDDRKLFNLPERNRIEIDVNTDPI